VENVTMHAVTEQRNTTREARSEIAAPAGRSNLSIALAGSGGSGVMTAGTLLLEAAANAGLYGLMVRTSGPQIRGGEAAALVRLAQHPVASLGDGFDLLIAIDWQNVNRFADEIVLNAASVVVGDADAGDIPEVFRASGARYVPLPLKKMVKAIPGGWINMIALGLAGALAGVPEAALERALRASWKRGDATLQPNLAALRAGRGGGEHCRRAAARAAGRCIVAAVAAERQRGGGLRCAARRRALRCRVSDHAGNRNARVALARTGQGRRHAAAGGR
jgi:Pyruvate/2-oxoacid:ferredoxin oxidoreductase gamma subunit